MFFPDTLLIYQAGGFFLPFCLIHDPVGKGEEVLLKIFEKINSNLFVENRLLRLTVVAIGIGQIILGFQVKDVVKNQRVVLVPMGLDHRVTLTGDYASEEYIKIFARQICSLAFTYSSSTARAQFGELLQLFSPEGFVSTKKILYDLATTIESTRTSSVFIPTRTVVDANAGKISVEGTQRIWVDTTFVDTQSKTYVIGYKIVDSKFVAVSLAESNAAQAAAATAPRVIQVAPTSSPNQAIPNQSVPNVQGVPHAK